MRLSINIYPDKPSYKPLKVTGLDGSNTLAEGFSYAVTVVSKEWLPNIVDQAVCLTLGDPKAPAAQKRTIKGFITAMQCVPQAEKKSDESEDQNTTEHSFILTVEPWLKTFSQDKKTRVFKKKTIGDIIETIFKPYYASAKELAVKVHNRCGSDDKLTYPSLTQLKQSDADFIQHVMARSGVFFYFDTDGNVVIHADITKAAAKAKTQTLSELEVTNQIVDMSAMHADEFSGCALELERAKWHESTQSLNTKTSWLKKPLVQCETSQGLFPTDTEQQLKASLEHRKDAAETHQQAIILNVISTPDGKKAPSLNGFAVAGEIKPSFKQNKSKLPKRLVVLRETITVADKPEDNKHTLRAVSLDGKKPQGHQLAMFDHALPNVAGLYAGEVSKPPKKQGAFVQLTTKIDWAAEDSQKGKQDKQVTEHHYPTFFSSLSASHYLAPAQNDTVTVLCLDGNPDVWIERSVNYTDKTMPNYGAPDGKTLSAAQGLNMARSGKTTATGITWSNGNDLYLQGEQYEAMAKEVSFQRATQIETQVKKKFSAETNALFIEADKEVTLAVGNSELVITPSKVTINGKSVKLNGVSPAELKQKLMQVQPKVPLIVDPTKPTPEQFVAGKIKVPG